MLLVLPIASGVLIVGISNDFPRKIISLEYKILENKPKNPQYPFSTVIGI
ncbi:MAG: hypothetical protein ACFE9Z_14930 [Promethearchaeota archaeon]